MPHAEAFRPQDRAIKSRLGALYELSDLVVALDGHPRSLTDLFGSLNDVQAQVHAVRKALVCEARVIGFSDDEIARILLLHPADFIARWPI